MDATTAPTEITALWPHAVVLLMDSASRDLPTKLDNGVVASTETCIAIACRESSNGPVIVTVGPVAQVAMPAPPAYVGVLATASGLLVLEDCEGRRLLQIATALRSHISIWVNDPIEADAISIGLV